MLLDSTFYSDGPTAGPAFHIVAAFPASQAATSSHQLGRKNHHPATRLSADAPTKASDLAPCAVRRAACRNRNSRSRDFYARLAPDVVSEPEAGDVGAQFGPRLNLAGVQRKFRTEMREPEAARLLDLLAALSHQTNFSLGCYCESEDRCHRSILRALLTERGAAPTCRKRDARDSADTPDAAPCATRCGGRSRSGAFEACRHRR